MLSLIFAFLMCVNLQGQTRSVFDTLSRKALILEALNFVDPPIDTSNFASIKVMASPDEIFVSFENPIVYVPQNSEYCYEVLVDLTNEMVSYEIRSNPEGYSAGDSAQYFKISPEQESEMLLALNLVQKRESSLKAYYETLNGTRYLILPADEHIDVWMLDDFQEVQYRIDRKTKQVTELIKAQLEPDLFFGSDFIEIKR